MRLKLSQSNVLIIAVVTGIKKQSKTKKKKKKEVLSESSDSVEAPELPVNNTNQIDSPLTAVKEETTPVPSPLSSTVPTSQEAPPNNPRSVPAAAPPKASTPNKRGRKKAPAHLIERDIEPLVIDGKLHLPC